jgi:hypothetical protein
MKFNFSDIIETIRIKEESATVKVLVAAGKENDIHVMIAPSIMVSGYGSNAKEAEQSFKHNMGLFCKDILALSLSTRNQYLKKLGFEVQKYQTKNFSKMFVDANGVLQGLDKDTMRTTMLEAVA